MFFTIKVHREDSINEFHHETRNLDTMIDALNRVHTDSTIRRCDIVHPETGVLLAVYTRELGRFVNPTPDTIASTADDTDDTVDCYACGESIPASEAFEGEDEHYCNDCYNEQFQTCPMSCEECDSTWYAYQLDDDNICPICLNSANSAAQQTSDINRYRAPVGVRDWNYRPAVCFCPEPDEDTIFYGYELEVESQTDSRALYCIPHRWIPAFFDRRFLSFYH